ncbi:hypothetical protein AB0C84_42930 [Actinomadura sp. NPDC048955]|uniref:hypothetical protein n=1 Tax=Actinomadura sp. NPDC048955 TaxID=3158228 RepID=UPI0033D9BB14
MREFPAFVSHEGLPRKPTEARLTDAPLRWRVVEVLNAAQNVAIEERSARKVYHLLVFGPMPYAPEQSGKFEFIAVDYVDRPYWWDLREFTHTEESSSGSHGLLERHGDECGGLPELLQSARVSAQPAPSGWTQTAVVSNAVLRSHDQMEARVTPALADVGRLLTEHAARHHSERRVKAPPRGRFHVFGRPPGRSCSGARSSPSGRKNRCA